MNRHYHELLLQTLALPVEQRAFLARSLLSSLCDLDSDLSRYAEAAELLHKEGSLSESLLMRRLRIGFDSAHRLAKKLRKNGIPVREIPKPSVRLKPI